MAQRVDVANTIIKCYIYSTCANTRPKESSLTWIFLRWSMQQFVPNRGGLGWQVPVSMRRCKGLGEDARCGALDHTSSCPIICISSLHQMSFTQISIVGSPAGKGMSLSSCVRHIRDGRADRFITGFAVSKALRPRGSTCWTIPFVPVW
jgi:hypothetical protein